MRYSSTQTDWVEDVAQFHRAVDMPIADEPRALPYRRLEMRVNLLQEEGQETIVAMRDGNKEGIADGLADLIYVAIGAALEFGIDLRPVWREGHSANMAKTGGPKRADGKQLKPEGWTAPDIAGALKIGDMKNLQR